MFGYALAFLVICALVALAVVLHTERTNRKDIRILEIAKVRKEYPEPHVMSWIGRQIMKKFNEVPESHKPAFDVRSAVVALDVKYRIDTLDEHYHTNTGHYSFAECVCTQPTSSGNKRERSCVRFPEFTDLWTAMREIEYALRRLEDARRERERQIELAGIENDLRSVDDILDAFRQEASILRETAREISA